jgi:uncharacterized membrane protein
VHVPRTILVAWTFYTAVGTESATEASRLVTESESGVHGAATVRWETDASMPWVSHPAARDGQVDAFWGLLFGLSLYVPLLSAAMCSPARTTIHGLVAVGISREFMNKLHDRITPYTHTVLIVAPHDVAERLNDEVAPLRPDEMVSSVMHLGEAFGVEDVFDSGPNQSTRPASRRSVP